LLDDEDCTPLERAGVTPIRLDVTRPERVRSAAARVQAVLDGVPLAGLVNNAGIASGGPIELLDLETVRAVFDVNVIGLLAVTQALLPMLRAARGRIVNISSVSGRLAVPFLAPYCGSKFAVEAISDCLRRELHPFGVDVVIVEPGVIRTPIWDKALQQDLERYRGTPYESVIAKALRRLHKGRDRGLDPISVARVVADALTVVRPPIRVQVVRNRRRQLMTRWMPDRVLDRMIARKVWGTT